MFKRLMAAGLFWPAVMTALMLVVLIGLGNWQLRRLAWKEQLLSAMVEMQKTPPKPLASIVTQSRLKPDEFTPVTVSGRFQHDQEFHVWSPGRDGPGWTVITPLRLDKPLKIKGRYPLATVLIMRGRVPAAVKQPQKRAQGQVKGVVEVVGRIRYGGGGSFSAAADQTKNQWYERDLEAMRRITVARLVEGSASGSVEEAMMFVAPFYIEADQAVGAPPAPQPDGKSVKISNRHFEYAMTWYGLALTLVGVFAAFAWPRLRSTGNSRKS